MSARLSPLNLRNLLVSQHLVGEPTLAEPQKKKLREGAGEAEACWRCCACESVFTYRHQAEDCCLDSDDEDEAEGLHDQEAGACCPVCAHPAYDVHDAADCCLWKDLDAATRWRMAAQVEAGSSWADVLGLQQAGAAS